MGKVTLKTILWEVSTNDLKLNSGASVMGTA